MSKNNTKRKTIFNASISLVLVAAILLSSAFAFLTAKDVKVNNFTVGDVEVELWEGFDTDLNGSVLGVEPNNTINDFDDDSDEVFGPEDGEQIIMTGENKLLPNQSIQKQPFMRNTGNNSAYVYMTVGVPMDNIVVSDPITGEIDRENSGMVEVFELENINPDWTLLSEEPVETKDGYNYYLFVYNEPLEAGEYTKPVFESVKYANVVENFMSDDSYSIPSNTDGKYISDDTKGGVLYTPGYVDGVNENQYDFAHKLLTPQLLSAEPVDRDTMLSIVTTYRNIQDNSVVRQSATRYIEVSSSGNPLAIYSGNTVTVKQSYAEAHPELSENYTVVVDDAYVEQNGTIPLTMNFDANMNSLMDLPINEGAYLFGNDDFDYFWSAAKSGSFSDAAGILNLKKRTNLSDLNLGPYGRVFDADGFASTVLEPGVYYLDPFIASAGALNYEGSENTGGTDVQSRLTAGGVTAFIAAMDDFVIEKVSSDKSIGNFGYKMPINSYAIQTIGVEDEFESGNEGKLNVFNNIINAKMEGEEENSGNTTPDVEYHGDVEGETLEERPQESVNLFDSSFDITNMTKVTGDYHDIIRYNEVSRLKTAKEIGYVKISDEPFSTNDVLNHIIVDSDNNGILSNARFDSITVKNALTYIAQNEPNLADYATTVSSVSCDFTKKAFQADSSKGLPAENMEIDWLVSTDAETECLGMTLEPGIWAFYYIDSTDTMRTFSYRFDGAAESTPESLGYTLVFDPDDTSNSFSDMYSLSEQYMKVDEITENSEVADTYFYTGKFLTESGLTSYSDLAFVQSDIYGTDSKMKRHYRVDSNPEILFGEYDYNNMGNVIVTGDDFRILTISKNGSVYRTFDSSKYSLNNGAYMCDDWGDLISFEPNGSGKYNKYIYDECDNVQYVDDTMINASLFGATYQFINAQTENIPGFGNVYTGYFSLANSTTAFVPSQGYVVYAGSSSNPSDCNISVPYNVTLAANPLIVTNSSGSSKRAYKNYTTSGSGNETTYTYASGSSNYTYTPAVIRGTDGVTPIGVFYGYSICTTSEIYNDASNKAKLDSLFGSGYINIESADTFNGLVTENSGKYIKLYESGGNTSQDSSETFMVEVKQGNTALFHSDSFYEGVYVDMVGTPSYYNETDFTVGPFNAMYFQYNSQDDNYNVFKGDATSYSGCTQLVDTATIISGLEGVYVSIPGMGGMFASYCEWDDEQNGYMIGESEDEPVGLLASDGNGGWTLSMYGQSMAVNAAFLTPQDRAFTTEHGDFYVIDSTFQQIGDNFFVSPSYLKGVATTTYDLYFYDADDEEWMGPQASCPESEFSIIEAHGLGIYKDGALADIFENYTETSYGYSFRNREGYLVEAHRPENDGDAWTLKILRESGYDAEETDIDGVYISEYVGLKIYYKESA